MTLQGGQANTLVLASFVFALRMVQKRVFWLAAFIIAAGFWFKLYPLALIALFGVSEKNSGIIWRTLMVTVALAVVALPVIPMALHHEYFGSFLPNLQRYTLPGIAHSLSAQLLYFQEPAPVALPLFRSVVIPGGLNLLSKGILLPGLLLSMLHMRLEGRRAPFEALALLLVTLLIASPLAWGHHFVLILPALAAVLIRLADNKAGLAESLIAVLCWLQFALPSWTSLPFAVGDGWSGRIIAHLFYARYLLAAFGLGGLIVAARAREYGPALKILAEKMKPAR